MLSEILASLFGCHREELLTIVWRRRPFSHEGEFEVSDDLINDFMILDAGAGEDLSGTRTIVSRR